jgi:hypothetical protein
MITSMRRMGNGNVQCPKITRTSEFESVKDKDTKDSRLITETQAVQRYIDTASQNVRWRKRDKKDDDDGDDNMRVIGSKK